MKIKSPASLAILSMAIALASSPLSAAEIDPCAAFRNLGSASTSTKSLSWETIKSFLYGTSVPAGSKTTTQPNSFFFTNSSDFALAPVCVDSGTRTEPSLLYPLGVVVKQIGEHTWPVGGKSQSYAYVITEYGLPLYIPKAQLSPVEPGKAYIFADSADPVLYCLGTPNCIPLSDASQSLRGTLRYAIAKTASVNEGSCSAIPIDPYNAHSVPTRERAAFLQPCLKDPRTGLKQWNGGIKIVTQEKAINRFNSAITGSFQRHIVGLLNRVTGGQILAEKVCGQKIDKSGSFVTAASVETKFDAGIFNVGGSVDTKLAEDIVTTLEPEHFLLFSTYTNGRLRFDDDPMKIKSRAHDLSFVAECDKEGRPDVGYYIIIYNPELPSGHFYVDARKVRRTYLSTFRTLGFTPSDDPDEIESGRFWRIWGVDQYFAWRTALLTAS